MTKMTEKRATAVYDLLVKLGGAQEMSRFDFVEAHTRLERREWRFQGKFGFGGKYRSESNSVDYYSEDKSPAREVLRLEINIALDHLDYKL